jgi:hypothetical protein
LAAGFPKADNPPLGDSKNGKRTLKPLHVAPMRLLNRSGAFYMIRQCAFFFFACGATGRDR